MGSVFGKINLKDLGKGLLIAFGTVILAGIVNAFNEGRLPTLTELGSLAVAGLAAAGAYLLKNLFTNSSNELLKKESDKIG